LLRKNLNTAATRPHKVEPMHDVTINTAAAFLFLLNPRRLYHRAEIEFAERFPASGGAVIVSNHGRLDFDSFILAGLILRSRKRLVRLMADHMWSRLPVAQRIMSRAGAVDGTRENAMHLLGKGEMILTYPGGVREIMSSRFGHERIDWQGRTGFAKVAIAAKVPVIPVAGIGVNNGFIFLSKGRLLGKLLFQGILRLGPAYKDYRDPLVIGLPLLPLPLSIAVHFPLPCKLRYVVGEPVYPEESPAERTEDRLAARVAASMKELINQYGRGTAGSTSV
jgi:1-acyl-sn-glycerol-3-phosphate acyltransferase